MSRENQPLTHSLDPATREVERHNEMSPFAGGRTKMIEKYKYVSTLDAGERSGSFSALKLQSLEAILPKHELVLP
jgi:hypothetical protein